MNMGSNQHTASRQAKPKHGTSRGVTQGSRNSGMGGVGGMGPLQEAAMALQKAANVVEDNLAERDPFYAALLRLERAKKLQEAQIPLLKPLSMDDLPEGFVMENLQFVFSKVQELRLAKLEKEVEAKRLQQRYSELKGRLDNMHTEEVALEGGMRGFRSSKEELIVLLRTLAQDLELVIALKQGQDEVNNDAIVTDYSDAMCMPVTVVQRFNSRIKELGRERIGMLTKIKTFRRKINLVDWEAKHLSLECRHLEEYYTDLQLFRVTRELQQILRDGSDAEKTKERLEKVSQRKDFMQKDADIKLLKLRKSKEQMRKQLSDRGEEIASLERKVSELKGQVAERQSVQQSRTALTSAAAGGAGIGSASNTVGLSTEALGRMKTIIARRHLVDTARAQAEEIDFLRQELDKVRQKTFPSFIRAVKKRLPNPDERL
jgi:ABC-type phosphate transport system auxiliary subunit